MGECVRGRVGNHVLQICKSEALKALWAACAPSPDYAPAGSSGAVGERELQGADVPTPGPACLRYFYRC